ncbi:MAG: RNA-binding cell elongation regulator Jag/EloR [Saccharofermentanales bacterium]|jgi:spoIIIJ-associated protein
MALSIEKSGKTVQRAINEALDELGLSVDDVVIEVLDEGEPGLLGLGRRPATVRITVEEPDQDRDTETTEYYGDDEDYAGDPETPEEAETMDYVASILSGIGIHGRISSYREGDTLHIDVTGQDCGAAIGRRGETLDAIQYLASLVANRVSETRIRVIVDIAGYRRRRQETLIGIAQRTAKKVARSGELFNLEPMNPAERRIIHAALQDFPGVTTYSEGEDAKRHVVVAPESVE